MASSTCSTPSRKRPSFEEPAAPHRSSSRGATPPSKTYTTYEDLLNCFTHQPDITTTVHDLVQRVQEDVDWTVQFDTIEGLRVLNKYYTSELRKKLSEFTPFLHKSVESLRSNVSKNTLMLIKEVFTVYRDTKEKDSDTFLNGILPVILEKSVSEKGFLKKEARDALKALEKTGCNNSVVRVLCDKSFDKNGTISELSFKSLAEIVQESKENLTEKISEEHMQTLFKTVAQLLDGKRAVNQRVAKGLCEQLKEAFSEKENDFQRLMTDKMKLKDNEAKMIMESLALPKKNTSGMRADFSGFIKTKKFKQVEEVEKIEKTSYTLISVNLKK